MSAFNSIANFLQASPDPSVPRALPIRLRHMVPSRDLLDVHHIETRSFSDPWRLEDLRCLLRRDGIEGTIAEAGSFVVGFAVTERTCSTLTVLGLAVDPEFRLRGIGRRLVGHLVGLSNRPERLVLDVPETDLATCQFLRACNIRAIGVLPARRYGGSADVIRFEDRAERQGR